MRKISNGLIFDTKKADVVCVAKTKNDVNQNATMYHTKNNRFFVVGVDRGNYHNQESFTFLESSHNVIAWLNDNREKIDKDVEDIIQSYFKDHIEEG